MRALAIGSIVIATFLLPGLVEADELILTGWHLTDNGDGDGFPDTGETVTLRVLVENRSDELRTGVVARLSGGDSGFACVVDGVVAVGDVPAGTTVVSDTGFEVQVGDVERGGACSTAGTLCADEGDCPAGQSCDGVAETLDFTLAVTLSSNQSGGLGREFPMTLAFDVDASGGGTPTSFFEGFESIVTPGIEIQNLDFGMHTGNPFLNSQGFRCQYNDPDWINSNSYGQVTSTLR